MAIFWSPTVILGFTRAALVIYSHKTLLNTWFFLFSTTAQTGPYNWPILTGCHRTDIKGEVSSSNIPF